jgi:hypothetical protein
MSILYCELCQRPVEARRRVGGWTHAFAFVSLGLAYLAVPFYRKRCPICNGSAVSQIGPEELARLSGRRRAAELEDRLALAVEELDSAEAELDRVRTERDFYRELSEEGKRREPT